MNSRMPPWVPFNAAFHQSCSVVGPRVQIWTNSLVVLFVLKWREIGRISTDWADSSWGPQDECHKVQKYKAHLRSITNELILVWRLHCMSLHILYQAICFGLKKMAQTNDYLFPCRLLHESSWRPLCPLLSRSQLEMIEIREDRWADVHQVSTQPSTDSTRLANTHVICLQQY